MFKFNQIKIGILTATFLTAGVLPAHVFAEIQTNKGSEDVKRLADVVVTAQYKQQNIQDVPSAITAVSGKDIAAKGQTFIGDVLTFAPNAKAQNTDGDSRPHWYIRHGRTDIKFGLSIDTIARATEEEAFAAAQRFLDEAAEKQRLNAGAAHKGLRSARVLSFEKEYQDKEGSKSVHDFFIHDNVWSGFGYIGIPPGVALVGSYTQIIQRIAEYQSIGVDLFFLAGYPHLEENYRLGEHVLPYFRGQREKLKRTTLVSTGEVA